MVRFSPVMAPFTFLTPFLPPQAGDANLVREIDLRPKEDLPGNYVVFSCARGGVPGHAFIVWGKDDDKKQVCSVEAFGLYPKAVTPNILLRQKVPGFSHAIMSPFPQRMAADLALTIS